MIILESKFNREISKSTKVKKFIAQLLDNILGSCADLFETEKMLKEEITEWNKTTKRNKFITGAGGHHLWIHLERKHNIHNRVAMIYERDIYNFK